MEARLLKLHKPDGGSWSAVTDEGLPIAESQLINYPPTKIATKHDVVDYLSKYMLSEWEGWLIFLGDFYPHEVLKY